MPIVHTQMLKSTTQVFYWWQELANPLKLWFKVEEGFFFFWSVSVHERIKRIELGHLDIWSISTATWRIFYSYWLSFFRPFMSFYFFIIFWPLCTCLGIKKVFAVYLILLGTRHMLESGPMYCSSSCLVKRLMSDDHYCWDNVLHF